MLMLYVPVNNFSVLSYWVVPVLSRGKSDSLTEILANSEDPEEMSQMLCTCSYGWLHSGSVLTGISIVARVFGCSHMCVGSCLILGLQCSILCLNNHCLQDTE